MNINYARIELCYKCVQIALKTLCIRDVVFKMRNEVDKISFQASIIFLYFCNPSVMKMPG